MLDRMLYSCLVYLSAAFTDEYMRYTHFLSVCLIQRKEFSIVYLYKVYIPCTTLQEEMTGEGVHVLKKCPKQEPSIWWYCAGLPRDSII